MAIATDAVSTSSGTGTTLTWAHTCSGTQRLLIVGVYTDVSQCTGVTYAGYAMTLVGSQGTTTGNMYMFMLFTTNTGANNIVVSLNANAAAVGVASSYTGTAGPSYDVFDTSGNSPVTTFTLNVTTTVDNDWLIGVGYAENSDGPTAGASTTRRNAVARIAIFDSNAAKTPPGSFGLTIEAGSSTILRMILTGIKPGSGSPTTSSTSTSTSTSSSSTSSSSSSSSSTTTSAPPVIHDETGIPEVYITH